ncbi:putative spermidine/putrescine transport system ATP-binding protein [Tistlia consotensis]|uniref:Putative spermidine/putrescine transport system ATP-binding protein n=1 Tax=Tistlia consotensis USBA 355 TaxID=560819 RepID=A0A1Y6C9I9_9PROT|nr:ABC transporter ATP-binding protein [Tistlia consotensis]SMF51722.1 putative spermidine/putrescine transport system ATP-binding protein [Tistlia consotensis USBA 355]SNR83820.1 putative spermidine/putrescine transport system ATP-binding protein [Tistlia consotensis]
MVAAVHLVRTSRRFGATLALDAIELEIAEGEFFGLLGPSGSGKTTCLRLIAGFDHPTSGHVEIFGQRCEDLPPYRRPVSTVFQDYALFPHMTVLDNVAYGLMVRGIGKAERYTAAREALALVKLAGFDARRPSELSGGQRQRVALARSLVTRPKVLLLDEPLGALDLKLREEMQVELKALQKRLGITFVFVTHDQGEALSMSDRIAVFDHGRVMQVGSPEAIYERPEVPFVADFVGGSNLIDGAGLGHAGVEPGRYSLRPEKIVLGRPAGDGAGDGAADGAIRAEGRIKAILYQGGQHRVTVALPAIELTVLVPAAEARGLTVGETLPVSWRPEDMHRMTGAA